MQLGVNYRPHRFRIEVVTLLVILGWLGSAGAAHTLPSIFVPESAVLCIASQGIQPSGKPVGAKGKRPAGISLSGVTRLRLGVRDGDVLTEIMGQPVRSVLHGVALIIAARANKLPSVSGTIWRGMRSYAVTVEQPYEMPDCSSDDKSCWKSHCAATERKPAGSAAPKSHKSANAQLTYKAAAGI